MNRNVVTFGDSLMRLSPPGNLRLRQATRFDLVFGGAEANVAISLAHFGVPVQYVTRLPDNELGVACRQALRQYGVGLDLVETGGDRLGIYFLEIGAGERSSRVIYDREGSAFATMTEETIDWGPALADAGWFHWSGISPAVSAGAARATAAAVGAARDAGLFVSCDLNYRHSLWQWGVSPSAFMPDLVSQCDVLAANTAHLMLDLPDLPPGRTPAEALEVCSRLAERYPNLKHITLTCRETVSAAEDRFTAVLWSEGEHAISPAFPIAGAVDRVGAGDAFMAGLIYGLLAPPPELRQVVSFAAAAAVLKHTIRGDANLVGVDEVEQLLAGSGFDIIR
jgi:2-dehydro-3-deoxygluconokinase